MELFFVVIITFVTEVIAVFSLFLFFFVFAHAVTVAHWRFYNEMHYVYLRFTYLLTKLV